MKCARHLRLACDGKIWLIKPSGMGRRRARHRGNSCTGAVSNPASGDISLGQGGKYTGSARTQRSGLANKDHVEDGGRPREPRSSDPPPNLGESSRPANKKRVDTGGKPTSAEKRVDTVGKPTLAEVLRPSSHSRTRTPRNTIEEPPTESVHRPIPSVRSSAARSWHGPGRRGTTRRRPCGGSPGGRQP
jgi:hypothetical protein